MSDKDKDKPEDEEIKELLDIKMDKLDQLDII